MPSVVEFIGAEVTQCTEVRFASFLSGGFTTMAVINPLERKLAKRTSVQWVEILSEGASAFSES